ncbi:SMC family ATPase [Propioniciclava sinopodophylli]|uniref:Nuclease SbcCD subunit C n=1 Tax=Propioniciclava sinopodophylli TaxID=1837344 RepID=A0A4Q9KB68_9ACTN|nr:SMC family ATPase [Propioniciclava sinopodophylli]TBT82996.1 SMC family ATPase [Propioniciclava sinopodophylli]
MRPVRLEMEGFASFRSATTVDFMEADYFALVGPTGSGKSTVIDAMVFALYGTAPRWGRLNAIANALAPTSTKGTVRLVFDVGTRRYQIAREVCRVGSAGEVLQKGAFLERFLDPSATSVKSDEVQTVAAELLEVKSAVEQLVGLDLKQFTQAVVLPQGRFAEFLSAKSSDRQDILLKLLGADRYERVHKAAAERQRDAEAQAAQVAALLEETGTATPAVEHESVARVAELKALHAEVEHGLEALAVLRSTAHEAEGRRQHLEDRAATLGGVEAPTGVADLGVRAESLARSLAEAREAESVAVEASDAAREALEALGARGAWERLRD